ncbi:MlaD family protein [Nocardia aobensis]|uniref:MlaD family protein n=1 Tax=Nocardia aobensis TaxID=257277 RepID=UPI0002F19259|nr:MlaD family protein [Nocardia aobensis]
MITRTRVSVVAMTALTALSLLYIQRVGLDVDRFRDTRTATMTVPDTNGVLVGARVLLRGVPIGKVTAITPVAGGVRLALRYEDSHHIPVRSWFRIDNLSALGESYISVLPDTANGPYLADGAQVAADRVSVPTTFEELSARLTHLLQQVAPDQVQGIFHALDIGLPGGVQVIGDLNRAGSLLAAEFTEQTDNLVTLLSTLQPLLMRSGDVPASLAATSPQLAGFGVGFQDLLNSVRDAMRRGPLLDGIRDGASPLFGELQKFLDHTASDLKVIGVNLLPAAQAGGAALRTVDLGSLLGRVLAATDPPGALTVHVPAVSPPN